MVIYELVIKTHQEMPKLKAFLHVSPDLRLQSRN